MSFASETTTYKPGSCYGRIVVIKRNGQDSASFDLTDASYLFGSSPVCDIRIQLATIDSEHCRVSANAQGQAVLWNLSETKATIINGTAMTTKEHILAHGDLITIVERSFRYEHQSVAPPTPLLTIPITKAPAPLLGVGTPAKVLSMMGGATPSESSKLARTMHTALDAMQGSVTTSGGVSSSSPTRSNTGPLLIPIPAPSSPTMRKTSSSSNFASSPKQQVTAQVTTSAVSVTTPAKSAVWSLHNVSPVNLVPASPLTTESENPFFHEDLPQDNIESTETHISGENDQKIDEESVVLTEKIPKIEGERIEVENVTPVNVQEIPEIESNDSMAVNVSTTPIKTPCSPSLQGGSSAVSLVVDNEISASPKLSPKIIRLDSSPKPEIRCQEENLLDNKENKENDIHAILFQGHHQHEHKTPIKKDKVETETDDDDDDECVQTVDDTNPMIEPDRCERTNRQHEESQSIVFADDSQSQPQVQEANHMPQFNLNASLPTQMSIPDTIDSASFSLSTTVNEANVFYYESQQTIITATSIDSCIQHDDTIEVERMEAVIEENEEKIVIEEKARKEIAEEEIPTIMEKQVIMPKGDLNYQIGSKGQELCAFQDINVPQDNEMSLGQLNTPVLEIDNQPIAMNLKEDVKQPSSPLSSKSDQQSCQVVIEEESAGIISKETHVMTDDLTLADKAEVNEEEESIVQQSLFVKKLSTSTDIEVLSTTIPSEETEQKQILEADYKEIQRSEEIMALKRTPNKSQSTSRRASITGQKQHEEEKKCEEGKDKVPSMVDIYLPPAEAPMELIPTPTDDYTGTEVTVPEVEMQSAFAMTINESNENGQAVAHQIDNFNSTSQSIEDVLDKYLTEEPQEQIKPGLDIVPPTPEPTLNVAESIEEKAVDEFKEEDNLFVEKASHEVTEPKTELEPIKEDEALKVTNTEQTPKEEQQLEEPKQIDGKPETMQQVLDVKDETFGSSVQAAPQINASSSNSSLSTPRRRSTRLQQQPQKDSIDPSSVMVLDEDAEEEQPWSANTTRRSTRRTPGASNVPFRTTQSTSRKTAPIIRKPRGGSKIVSETEGSESKSSPLLRQKDENDKENESGNEALPSARKRTGEKKRSITSSQQDEHDVTQSSSKRRTSNRLHAK